MPRNWQATDSVDIASDSMVEQFGNLATYNVVDGCDITYSASGLSVSVSAGSVTHNGARIAVAGGSITLVPDATYPMSVWVAVNSSGTVEAVTGTAAAEPVVPELGDRVEIALVKVEANQTIAAACEHKMDRRLFGPTLVTVGGSDSASATLSADAATTSTMANVVGLSVSVAANTVYAFRLLIHYTASASADYSWRVTGPTGAVVIAEQSVGYNLSAVGEVRYAASTSATGGSANGFGTSTPGVLAVYGSLLTGATAGTLQYQHKSDASGKTKAKSRLELL